jgi:predicted DNA-binding transcriptional regulator AlpA
MRNEVPRVIKMRTAADRTMRVRFAGERREHHLDLTGLIARSTHFGPLMDDGALFAKAAIVEDGLGIAWPVATGWGSLDLSASTLRRIAEEQRPMTGEDFARWRDELGLSLTEAAKLLGISRRTVMGYLKKYELPPIVAIACRALARDKHLFAAHYVPARRTGRTA